MLRVSGVGQLRLGCRQAVRHQTLTLAFVGSNPAIPASAVWFGLSHTANDPLAQLAEQLPFKQWVRSSNLRRVTRKREIPKRYLPFSALYKGDSKEKMRRGRAPPARAGPSRTFIFAIRRRCKRIDRGSRPSGRGQRHVKFTDRWYGKRIDRGSLSPYGEDANEVTIILNETVCGRLFQSLQKTPQKWVNQVTILRPSL